MRLRTFIVALLVGAAVLTIAPQASATEGWAWRGKTWIHWHYRDRTPAQLEGRGAVIFRDAEKAAAIRAGVNARKQWLRGVAALLRRSRRVLASARAVISYSGAFPASCVAMAEEGGRNSVAGYFGFIYPPSSYGASGYGESWLNWPYGAQLQVALDLYSRYGGSAWGPLTRSKCGI